MGHSGIWAWEIRVPAKLFGNAAPIEPLELVFPRKPELQQNFRNAAPNEPQEFGPKDSE